MEKDVVLITGANGEVGHGLTAHLARSNARIVTLDLQPVDKWVQDYCLKSIQGDILDSGLLEQIAEQYQIETIYHLASILSTQAERSPETAHRVNVEGTLNLLRFAAKESHRASGPIRFLYPSSIAAYGLPDLITKMRVGRINEYEWCLPTTMYGCNKLYCELIGRYYSCYYKRLDNDTVRPQIDFRALRFPGLISAATVPTGGTSDYGPEILHHAAKGLPYECFVRPDTLLPFMVMPDAVKALVQLAAAPRERLSCHVYNVTSFSLSAFEIAEIARKAWHGAKVAFNPDPSRQAIIDSWPGDIDDSAARRDWNWQPDYDQVQAFEAYLIPALQERYGAQRVKAISPRVS
jgi:threonine 3-dehydrogenase